MFKKVVIAAGLIVSFANVSFATTFEDALSDAYENNPTLIAARHNVKVVDEAMPEALSGFLPSVYLTGERGRSDRQVDTLYSNRVTDTKAIQITQPLFRGGQTIYGIKEAKSSIYAARADLQSVEQEVLLDAVTAYMNMIRDNNLLDLASRNVNVLENHLAAARERFKHKEVSRTDVAQAEARLAESVLNKIHARGVLQSSMAFYKRVTGRAPKDLESFKKDTKIDKSLGELIDIALVENPSITTVKNSKNASKNRVKASKGALLPTVDFEARKQRQKGALFTNGDIDNETYSVSVTMPLYQSGAEYSNIRKEKQRYKQLGYELIDQQDRVTENVIRAYNEYEVAKAAIVSTNSAIRASKTALEGTKKEASVGSRTTLDVLDAEQELFEAESNLIAAKSNEAISYYRLLSQMGRLNPKYLNLNVKIYDPKENYNRVKYKSVGF